MVLSLGRVKVVEASSGLFESSFTAVGFVDAELIWVVAGSTVECDMVLSDHV